MKPFWLYTDIQPALGRSDVYLAVTNFAAEPEPFRELLHFPDMDGAFVGVLASRVARLELESDIIPRLSNSGIHDGRYFLAFSLGRLSTAPALSLPRRPVPSSFWEQLDDGLRALHAAGLTYGHLRNDTVAITDRGAPLLFDVTGLRSVKKQSSAEDFAAMEALRERLA